MTSKTDRSPRSQTALTAGGGASSVPVDRDIMLTAGSRVTTPNADSLTENVAAERRVDDKPPPPAVIDCQCHWYPPAFLKHYLDRDKYPRASRVKDDYIYEVSDAERWRYTRRFTDLDLQMAELGRAGIDAIISSPVVAGDVSERPLAEAIFVCDLLNNELAAAQRAYPQRFVGLAVLPMQDSDAAVQCLERATEEMGLRGVCMHANIHGASIADRTVWPVYECAERLGVPVFLHPTRCCRSEQFSRYNLELPLGYMFDTSIAALSLIVAGVLDAFPDLTFVHPHLGGTLPYLAGRLEVYRGKGFWPTVRAPIHDYLQRFYFDTVSATSAALDLVVRLGGTERLLFASDYPYWDPGAGLAFVRKHLPRKDLPDVLGRNAGRLLESH